MSRRDAKRKPVTAAELEGFLDYIARLMDHLGPRRAELLLPHWRNLQRQLKARTEADDLLAEARSRLTQLPDRTAA